MVVTAAVGKSRQERPVAGDPVTDVQGGKEKVWLVVDVAAGKEHDTPVSFYRRSSNSLELIFRGEQ
jgi:hypothetical protein